MRRVLAVIAAVLFLPLAALQAQASTGFRVPYGYHVAAWDKIGSGLDRISIRNTGKGWEQSVQVARLRQDAPFALRAVVSNQAIHGGTETTSSMCRRVGCVAGVNGDFFTVRSGQPVGGLTVFGQAIRSPDVTRPQLVIGGNNHVSIAQESWAGQITLGDGTMTLDGVNIPVRGGKVSLFTAAYGRSTGNARGIAEIAFRIMSPRGPLKLGQPATIQLLSVGHMGNMAIPGDGAVIAGEGAGAHAIDTLWWKLQHGRLSKTAKIVVRSSTPADGSIGGSPVLLRDGRRAFQIIPSNLETGRHPRTVVGWNKAGEVFLVTMDGRQPGYAQGVSLQEAADMMQLLGATDAINLDGGGSTTFVTKGGHVVNRPSDLVVVRGGKRVVVKSTVPGDTVVSHHENAVATALVIVPVAVKRIRPAQEGILPALRRSGSTRFLPPADDPAVGTIATATESSLPPRMRMTLIALSLAMAVGSAVYPATRRWRHRRR